MAKDYHKGIKLQCYIHDELSQKLDNYIQNYNRYAQALESDESVTKADVVRLAISEYLEKHDINS